MIDRLMNIEKIELIEDPINPNMKSIPHQKQHSRYCEFIHINCYLSQ